MAHSCAAVRVVGWTWRILGCSMDRKMIDGKEKGPQLLEMTSRASVLGLS